MTSNHEREIIVNHALLNEENLGIALTIWAAYDELCGRVVLDFIEAVERGLAQRLTKKWQLTVTRDRTLYADKYTEFLVAKYLNHPAGFCVSLAGEGEGFPKRPYFAIRYDKGLAVDPTLLKIVKDMLDRDYGPGKAADAAVWYHYVEGSYSGWGTEGSTVQLYRKKEAVTYFVGHLKKLADILETVLTPQSDSRRQE